jgi:hypothetical protein
MHFAIEIFSEIGSVKGKFCPNRDEMVHELKTGIKCVNYKERNEKHLYLRERSPRVIDADRCFYD